MNKNIVPFIKIREYFDNVVMSNMGDMIGDCKVCKAKQTKIFEHPCWNVIIEESKKAWEKANANIPTPPNGNPIPPVDSEGKTES